MSFQTARLVLASQSASRLALLEAAGLVVEALPARVDEAAVKRAALAENASTDITAGLLAEMKARKVAKRRPDALVIGADQMLVCERRWFDKPADMEAARAQLIALRGREHVLVSAVVVAQGDHRLWRHVAQSRLTMRAFSDAFLDAYLASEGEALLATVGAYYIERLGIHLFDRVEGEHAAILGLPLLPLLGFLRQNGAVLA